MPARDIELSRRVAEQLAAARRARGWSLEEVAHAAGLHRTSVGLIERGQRAMTLDVADRIARSLGLRLSEVIGQAEQARHPKSP